MHQPDNAVQSGQQTPDATDSGATTSSDESDAGSPVPGRPLAIRNSHQEADQGTRPEKTAAASQDSEPPPVRDLPFTKPPSSAPKPTAVEKPDMEMADGDETTDDDEL